jgi:transposase
MRQRRKHRLWTTAEKRSICQQTRAPGVSVAQVARRYALNANLIFKWLKDPRFAPAGMGEDEAVFLPVEIKPRSTSISEGPTLPMSLPSADGHGRVEILLSAGHRMTIDGAFDGDAVAMLVKALAQP